MTKADEKTIARVITKIHPEKVTDCENMKECVVFIIIKSAILIIFQ